VDGSVEVSKVCVLASQISTCIISLMSTSTQSGRE
jgi:hypothetical protein